MSGSGNINVTYDDAADTITVSESLTTTDIAEGDNLYYTDERVDDRVGALIVGGANITATYNDGAGTLTIDADNIGDVTGVTAGSGMTGGGSSGDLTLNVIGGDGITANADDVAVDSTVVRTSGSQTIAGAKTFSNDAVFNGNLTVNGTQTIVNTETLTVDDNIIVLNNNESGTPSQNAGIEVERGSSTNVLFRYNEGSDIWQFTNDGSSYFPVPTSTSDLAEGTNLYYTDTRARAAISVSGDLSYNSSTGVISFTNDAGDIESVTAGVGLSGGGSSGAVTLDLDFSELDDMTGTMDATDEFIILDSGTGEKRKAANEIGLSVFNNDSGFTTNVGDITGVTAGSGMTGGGTSGGAGVTANADDVAVDLSDTTIFTSGNFANRAVVRDGSGNFEANVITATATSAQYADLAENYLADKPYEPGTVLIIGGSAEVTEVTKQNSPAIAGVVSTEPAHLMNSALEGDNVVAVALKGRVPVKVVGAVRKGDVLIASNTPGHAQAAPFNGYHAGASAIGVAISENLTSGTGVVEALIK